MSLSLHARRAGRELGISLMSCLVGLSVLSLLAAASFKAYTHQIQAFAKISFENNLEMAKVKIRNKTDCAATISAYYCLAGDSRQVALKNQAGKDLISDSGTTIIFGGAEKIEARAFCNGVEGEIRIEYLPRKTRQTPTPQWQPLLAAPKLCLL
jgi:hypothetical protein